MSVADINFAALAWIALSLVVIVPMLYGWIGGAPTLPTPWPVARRMAELARIQPTDHVIDPGCGDGRLLVACLEAGAATAEGYELFLFAYLIARYRALRWGGRMRIRFRNSRRVSYAGKDVLVCYMLPINLERMIPQFRQMRPGARVVSYSFAIKGWMHAHKDEHVAAIRRGSIYVYEDGGTR